MSHAKVSEGILDSSLWVQREERSLFLTALFMAKPYILEQPAPQLAVRSIEPTGYVVPPGRYGLVKASGTGIIRRDIQTDTEIGLRCLETLSAPDPDSRSPEHDGRRLARIDGGYLVLNYARYYDRDWTASERVRRWRQNRQASPAEQQPDTKAPPSRQPGPQSPPAAAKPAKKAARPPYDDGDPIFEEAWALWLTGPLKRAGLNKPEARRKWLARIPDGDESESIAMLEGTRRYAAYIQATQTDPKFIKMPETFYGPARHYQSDWAVEPGRGNGRGTIADRVFQSGMSMPDQPDQPPPEEPV